MPSYKVISSDSHIVEPPDLWEKRIEPRFRDRAPYVVEEEDTDQWYADGDVKFGNFAIAQAGMRFEAPEKLSVEGRYANVPLGGYDPHAHIRENLTDGVEGSVIYPSMGLNSFSIPAGDLLSAIFRGYNDWLADFCQPYPNQLKGIAMINEDDVKEAVTELERTAKMGLAGAMITVQPTTRRYNDPEYEPLWAAAADLAMPLSLHVGTNRWRPGVNATDLPDATAVVNGEIMVRNAIADIILSGVFERHPKLTIGAVEWGLAWAADFMGRMDYTFGQRIAGWKLPRFKDGAMPSDFFRSNVFMSFQGDDLGIQLRSFIGIDNLLWGSDYPHADSTFPKSQEILEQIFRGLDETEKAKIAGENTAKLYHFKLN